MAPSSLNEPRDLAQPFGFSSFLCLAWAFAFFLSVLLNASVLVDVSAFLRFSSVFDVFGVAAASTAFGYLGIFVIAGKPAAQRVEASNVTETWGWAVLSLVCYTAHVLLLRWPWISRVAEVGSRRSVWSALLSTTYQGVPWLAFGELLSIAVLLVHASVGALSATEWRRFGNLPRRGRSVFVALVLSTYALSSAVVVALATGRR